MITDEKIYTGQKTNNIIQNDYNNQVASGCFDGAEIRIWY